MDEFQQKLVLALVDKIPLLILALLGAFATFKASKALEAYKSAQAMDVELGKAKAAAVLRVLQALSECRFKSVRILTEAAAPDCDDAKLMKLSTEFLEDWRNLQGQLGRERMLIGEITGRIAHSFGCAASAVVTAAIEIRHARNASDTPESARNVAGAREELDDAMKEMEAAAFLLERLMPSLNPHGPAKLVRRRLEEIRKSKFTDTESATRVLSAPQATAAGDKRSESEPFPAREASTKMQ
jgi:hypothetical protein